MTTRNPATSARLRLDLTNRRFGLLVARTRLPKQAGSQGERWWCECDCLGAGDGCGFTEARVKDLSSGNTRSCGCLAHRPRREAGVPYRADPGLQAAVTAAVGAALDGGGTLREAALRRAFAGRASRSTIYRFIRNALVARGGDAASGHPPALAGRGWRGAAVPE